MDKNGIFVCVRDIILKGLRQAFPEIIVKDESIPYSIRLDLKTEVEKKRELLLHNNIGEVEKEEIALEIHEIYKNLRQVRGMLSQATSECDNVHVELSHNLHLWPDSVSIGFRWKP